MKEYIIVEQGQYSDYGVSIIDVTNCPLSLEEIYTILKIDNYDRPSISGKITGEIDFYDNSSIDIKDLNKEIVSNINNLFSCYNGKKYPSVLDRLYTKEECLKIADTNDGSGIEYWKRIIDDRYNSYLKGYEIYRKLTPSTSQTGESGEKR